MEESSWCAADAMKEQNPFVFLPYVLKQNLSKHNYFKWVLSYAKDKENIINMFKVNATRSKPSSKMPKFKFGVQVSHSSRKAYKLDDINKK